jgi:branched-chain amino acid transport system ATP-binding protein
MTNILSVGDLSVSYGKIEALHQASIAVPAGGIVAVIGPNGAGKTTMLNAIMGLLPARGAMVYRDAPLGRLEIEERVAAGLCLVPERRELFGRMSVEDNLVLGAFLRRRDGQVAADLDAVFQRFPRLSERRRQLALTLSGGERQMLAVGRALMSKPKLLMLDEPSLGLAPLVVRDIFATIAALRATGVTILLVEQNARAALEVADYGYVLEMGEIALEGPADDLAKDPRVIETYLGATRKKSGA